MTRRFFIQGETQDIDRIQLAQSDAKSSEVYDLQGRKVNGQLPRGIYILGGKKVLK